MGTRPVSYSTGQKVLHWMIAALIVAQVIIGILIVQVLKPGPVTNVFYEVHKSFGLSILALALVRVAVRWRRGAPSMVEGLPVWQRVAARTSHYALYVLIVIVPLAGWTATSTCCPPVRYFWTVDVTLPVEVEEGEDRMEAAKPIFRIHRTLALTLAGLVLIHAGAALHHHFVRRDETLRRMLPAARTP
jgi:cytochrome b561